MARGYFEKFKKTDYLFSNNVKKSVTDLTKYTSIIERIADDVSFYNIYTIKPSERLDNISQKLYDNPNFYWTIPILNAELINIWRDIGKDTNDFESFIKAKYPGFAIVPDESTPIVGNFTPGEEATIGSTKVRIVKKFASENYIQIEPIDSISPSALEGQTIVGNDSGDSIIIESVIPMTDAPALFLDSDNNKVIKSPNSFPVTWRDREREINDANLRIRVIRPEFIFQVVRDFEREMKK
jgi:hypothetical protein